MTIFKDSASQAHSEETVCLLRSSHPLYDTIAAIANWIVWQEDMSSKNGVLDSMMSYLKQAKQVSV
jgi:hypothetical protein